MFFRKKQSNYLYKTKKIKINGILFEIKKIDVFDHLKGFNSLKQIYDVYSINKDVDEVNMKKVKEHYIDVFMSSVIKPKLTLKEDDSSGIYVGELFIDWEVCTKLYENIMDYTYGKKKMKLLDSLGKGLLNLI